MYHILSIDTPAERKVSNTGWFLGRFSDTTPLERDEWGVVEGGFEGFCEWIGDMLMGGMDIVVCESYKVFNRAGDPTPMLSEGVVRYLHPDTVLQPSSGYKTAVPDKVIRRMGWWNTDGHHQDARAATRHALKYMFDKRHVPTLQKGWGDE